VGCGESVAREIFKTALQEQKRLLSLRLLGAPEASLKGHPPLRFGRKKALALLCYLAAEGERHPRRVLAELLWPRSDERHARMNLRAILSKLVLSLGDESAHDGEEESGIFVIESDRLGLVCGAE
jgi:DNA-binding SARP family transcriptional activator